MSGLTLHGQIVVLDGHSCCLAVLTSEELDNDGKPLHSETVPFMAGEPSYKGGLVIRGLAERVTDATLASVVLFAPTTQDELFERQNREWCVQIGDDDATRIGLDELVEAFLVPCFDSMEDHDYWRRLVGLTCAVFGLEHHAWEIELARTQIVNSVVPLQWAMEVPEPFGPAFQRHHHDISQLTNRVRSLQRAFLRDALLAMDPQIEYRSTTVGRLRELGLPQRHYATWEDL